MSHAPEANATLPNIASLLSATYHFAMGRIIGELESSGYNDLSKTQLHLLSRVERDGVTVETLSERLHMAKQIVWNLTHMLAENGYVVEEEDLSGKVSTIRLADRGEAVMKTVECAQRDVETDWADALGDESYTELRGKLLELFRVTTH